VTAGALGLEDLGVEDRLRLRVVLVAREAGRRKRRVDRLRVRDGPVVHDVAAGTVPKACGRLMCRSRGSQIAVTIVAGARHRFMQEVGLCPIRIVRVTACALGLDGLGVEDRFRLRVVLVTRHAGCRKRRVQLCRVGDGPIADDVTRGAIGLALRGLVRGRVRSPIGVTVQAGARHRRVEEVGPCPIRIVPVTADAIWLPDLGVEDRLRSGLVLVTGQAGFRKRRVDRGRHRGNPLALRVAVLACGGEGVVRWAERCLEIGLMTRDAFGLNDRPWFMRGTTNGAAPHADQYARTDPDGPNAATQLSENNPHGLYGTRIN